MSELVAKWQEPFTWLTEEWRGTDQTWAEMQPGFLARMGLSDSSSDGEVENLFHRIDDELTSDDERWRALVDESLRESTFPELYTAADEPVADDVDVAEAAPDRFWDGERWLVLDTERNEWVPADAEPATDEAVQSVEAVEAGPDEPAAVVGSVVDDIATPALAELVAEMPELAGLSADELTALLGDVLAERLAAAGA
jgi:hypothetical protein